MNILEKLINKEILSENEIDELLGSQKKAIDSLQKTNLKLANAKSNEAITRKALLDYNYKIECLKAAPDTVKEYDKGLTIAADTVSKAIINKMEWWHNA